MGQTDTSTGMVCIQLKSLKCSRMLFMATGLQIRSRVEEITFLPQWSPPITLSISTLPPPTIVSSELIQTKINVEEDSGRFTVNATVQLSLEQPQGSEDLDLSEVWIGDRNLMEYEEPESGISGVVFQFQVSSKYVHI